MEQRSIKIKSFQDDRGLGLTVVVLYLAFGIIGLVNILLSQSIDWEAILSAIAFMLFPTPFLVCHILLNLFCKTYDIYSEWGVKRINKKKVIFDVPWSKVLQLRYIRGIPYIYPARLIVELCSCDFEGNIPEGGGEDFFCTPMNKKALSAITELLPPNIKDGVNLK